MNRFKDLKVWNTSVKLAKEIYSLTKSFPDEEKFGLVSQIRRASISISSNIVEGAGRNNKREFNHFIGIALGSAFEVESQLIVSTEIGFCSEKSIQQILDRVNHIQNMLYKLQQTL